MRIRIICILLLLAVTFGFAGSPRDCPDEVVNQSALLNPGSKSFDFFATLLVWTAREVGTDCWAEVITTDGSISSNSLKQVRFNWSPGFRIGALYGTEYDQWDTQACYTWFYTCGHDRISSDPGTVYSTFLGNFYVDNSTGSGIHGPAYQRAHITWTVHFNVFDWELGRNFWVSKSLALRPFVGIKGGWIDQSIHSNWGLPSLPPGAELYNTSKENIENNFWGIGPSAGLNMKWNLYSQCWQTLHLFGDFSGALMWGHWSFSDIFNNDVPKKITVNLQNINSGASVVRTFMGLGWSGSLSQNRYQLSAKLGYEAQFWLNQLQFYSFVSGRLDTALTLQGGSLEFSFEF